MKNQSSVFCNIETDKIILKNDPSFLINDKYPHSKRHILKTPFFHIENYFELTKNVQTAMAKLFNEAKIFTDNKYNPSAYNLIINIEKSPGQIIMHTNIYLIPG